MFTYRTVIGIHEERQRRMLEARDESRLRRLARGTGDGWLRTHVTTIIRTIDSVLESMGRRDRRHPLERWTPVEASTSPVTEVDERELVGAAGR